MPRRRRKKSKGFSNISLIYITTISMLNLVGVSYGIWSGGLNIKAALTTGDIDPYFKNVSFSGIDSEDSENLDYIVSEDGKKIEISGSIYDDFNGTIDLVLGNDGTIPIVSHPEVSVFENIINWENNSEISIEKRGSQNRNLIIQPNEEKLIDFTYELEFEQDTE